MPSTDTDQAGSSGIFRLYRSLFILTVAAYVIAPFADDVFALYEANITGGIDTAKLASAVQISLGTHKMAAFLHFVGCGLGVGLVVWQAQDDEGTTYLLGPLIAAISVFSIAMVNIMVGTGDLDPLTRAAKLSLGGDAPMLYLSENFGVLGAGGHGIIVVFFVLLAAMGQVLKIRQDAHSDASEAARGQRPEGWSKK